MGSFSRTSTVASKSMRRLAPDMGITLGKADVTIEPFQALAQNNTDGKFYKYVKDDVAVGVIAGIYTGPSITLTAAGTDETGSISSLMEVSADDIVGVTFATDFKAITMCKQCGLILTTDIDGTKEA